MVQIYYTDRFIRSARQLPVPQQRKLAALLEDCQKDPFHPLLHTKPLVGKLSGLYSFRITRDYRVIFQFVTAEAISIIDVGHRRDIYE